MTDLACRTRRTGRDEQETEQGGGKGKKEGEMAPPGGCQGQFPMATSPTTPSEPDHNLRGFLHPS